MRRKPGAAALKTGAQADSVHAPTDATRVFERTGYQLFERMDEQLAFADRRKKRERGNNRLGSDAPFDRIRDAAGGQSPQSSTHAPELRGDRGFGKRREGAEAADPSCRGGGGYRRRVGERR